MSQLGLGDKHCVEKFLDLGVSGLGFAQDLTHKVHRSLYFQSVALLFPFYDQRGADYLSGRRYVEEGLPSAGARGPVLWSVATSARPGPVGPRWSKQNGRSVSRVSTGEDPALLNGI